MSEKKEFKAESKRLLEMMINSIYTHKEIFLRELISNASDAVDKLYFKSMRENLGLTRDNFSIQITPAESEKFLRITDNGIGMTKDELESNLGVIAKSGSLDFKNNLDKKESEEDVSIIGQFGVGFYSAFMVAKKVVVKSKAYGAETAYCWISDGVDGYTIEECADFAAKHGTEITLYIKDDEECEHGEGEHEHEHSHESFSDYLKEYRLKDLIKRYSDYIRYPIKLPVTKREYKDGKEEKSETVIETINSMVPIWKRGKGELSDEDYNKFYKDKFTDYTDPLTYIHSKTEGTATYNALLFIPKKPPYDFYTKEYEKGLQLYSSGVMIMEKCGDLLPDHFSFVKGLVDSEDLSLNISREMLQHDRQLKIIAKSVERSIKNDLKKMLANEREKYEEFWKTFGVQLKFGVYNGFGANKSVLEDLIMFTSSNEGNPLVTLAEYKERMKESQEDIYYASGESAQMIDSLPQAELVKDKGFEILYLTENVDEFCVQMLTEYEGKHFKSIQSADFDLQSEEEKNEIKEINESHKDLFAAVKDSLGNGVEVRASKRLKSHAVCLTSSGALSLEMEKVLNAMPNGGNAGGGAPKADKVLEINASHPIMDKLQFLFDNDKDKLGKYGKLLYNQALMIEGLPVENPAEFGKLISEIMVA